MNDKLRENLIKLGSTNPELRPHIRPLLAATPKVELSKSQRDVVQTIVHDLGILARPQGAKPLAVQAKKLRADMASIVGARGFSRDPNSAAAVEVMLGRLIEVAKAVDDIMVETVGMPQRDYRGTTAPKLEKTLWPIGQKFPDAHALFQGMVGLDWYKVKEAKQDIDRDMPGMASFEALKQKIQTDQNTPDQFAYNPEEQWLYESGNWANKRGMEKRLTDFADNVFQYALGVAENLAVVEKDSRSLLAYFKRIS
jgi:hypothetical protein